MNARPRKTDKLLDRDGRFFARIVVPKDLRPFVGRTELRTALGPDRRQANKLLPAALADLHTRLAAAERQRSAKTGKPTLFPRFPLTPAQIAGRVYAETLASDQAWRESEFSKQYTEAQIDWDEARRFRDGYSGKLSDHDLQELVGLDVDRFRARGNHDAPFGSVDWRRTAQAICYARAEAYVRQEERNEGKFNGEPERPILLTVEPDPLPEAAPVSLADLLDRYLKQGEVDGKESAARRRWTPVFESLKQHLKHDDAGRLTKADVIAWLDTRAEHLAPKTIADVYLASLRAVLTWAHENELIPANPAAGIKRRKPKKVREREKGFTDAEALMILRTASDYQPAPDTKGRVREHPEMTAAKRWTPWLAAFSGARIAELTQLRKQDVREEGGIHYLRITPEAGSVKSAQFRDVPLHPQLVERGFLDFVNASAAGPLFFKGGERDAKAGANMVAGRVSQWLQKEGIIPEGVQPNHAWRHRMKTAGEELGISTRVLDAIQGHAARTAGENYGDVTLKAKQKAISALPEYNVGKCSSLDQNPR